MKNLIENIIRYTIIAVAGLVVIALVGCKSAPKLAGGGVVMTSPDPIEIRPLVKGAGAPVVGVKTSDSGDIEETQIIGYEASGAQFDGMMFSTDDVAMQMGMLAQGLPVENWFQASLPDLFGPNIEEVRSDIIKYGAQLQMWALTIVEVHPFETTGITITQKMLNGDEMVIQTPGFKTPLIRFPTSQPPEPPKSLSGLQRLGIGGAEILSGLVSFFAYDVLRNNATPTVVESPPAQVIEVPVLP